MELKPGRELDALVAEKVMGEDTTPRDVKLKHTIPHFGDVLIPYTPRPYSTDIAAAMEVRTRAKISQITWIDDRKVMARFGSGKTDFAVGESESHAICLAALKAIAP